MNKLLSLIQLYPAGSQSCNADGPSIRRVCRRAGSEVEDGRFQHFAQEASFYLVILPGCMALILKFGVEAKTYDENEADTVGK